MKSIKHIYENSNFYKEVRIVSLLDRLFESVIQKIKNKVSISSALRFGRKNDYSFFYEEHTQMGITLIKKYKEHFFIVELMDKKEESYFSNATHSTNETSSDSSSNSKKEEAKAMGQTFYRCKIDDQFRGGTGVFELREARDSVWI